MHVYKSKLRYPDNTTITSLALFILQSSSRASEDIIRLFFQDQVSLSCDC